MFHCAGKPHHTTHPSSCMDVDCESNAWPYSTQGLRDMVAVKGSCKQRSLPQCLSNANFPRPEPSHHNQSPRAGPNNQLDSFSEYTTTPSSIFLRLCLPKPCIGLRLLPDTLQGILGTFEICDLRLRSDSISWTGQQKPRKMAHSTSDKSTEQYSREAAEIFSLRQSAGGVTDRRLIYNMMIRWKGNGNQGIHYTQICQRSFGQTSE